MLSMTGQGHASSRDEGILVTAEIRSVNNRFFKLNVVCPDSHSALEPQIGDLIKSQIKRGTVSARISINRQRGFDQYRINPIAVRTYQKQLADVSNGTEPVKLEAILALPGVVDEMMIEMPDPELDWPIVHATLTDALNHFHLMRLQEGESMKKDMVANCERIRDQLSSIEERSPVVVDSYTNRLLDRINNMLMELNVKVDKSDIIREVGIFADRCDIAEEVVRLRIHLQQFDSIVNGIESNGRKLDFLTQELLREANTIGSKANDAEIAKHVVEIKTIIERIREMVQNIE
jgi:uncharacterized protein (TIGR00255 family)